MATSQTARPLPTGTNTSERIRRLESMSRPNNASSVVGGSGLARNPSFRSRPIRKPATRTSIGGDQQEDEQDGLSADNAQLIASLKAQVERAEQASEQYRQQLEIVQKRLDEHTDLLLNAEEKDLAVRTQHDRLLAEARESARHRRELELNFESERNVLLQERDHLAAREGELQLVITRLTESVKSKNRERADSIRATKALEGIAPSPTRNNFADEQHVQLLQEKDHAIDMLKLELADVHLKVAESEHIGDGRMSLLESQLQDLKMQNARLVEENDSFQMLLGQRTMRGDFNFEGANDQAGLTSLAEELEGVEEGESVPAETYRKLETELKASREKEKALTLYVDKIIGKILQQPGAEHIIFGNEAEEKAMASPPKKLAKEKPLPLAPSMNPNTAASEAQTMMGGFLQRAKSVVSRPAPPRARPISYIQPHPSANENPHTAPSIPLNKGHRRARSDQMQVAEVGVEALNMVSPAMRATSGGPLSPTASGSVQRSQTTYFSPQDKQETMKALPTQAESVEQNSSRNSIASNLSFERQSTEATSIQTSTHTRDSGGHQVLPAGVMKQNQLRPLRLVQEQAIDEETMKKANRQSWMGWFNKAAQELQ